MYVINGSGMTTISGTTFISNTAVGLGGGFYTFGPVTMLAGHLEANQSQEGNGGGSWVTGNFTSSGGTQVINNSAGSGGGIAVDGDAIVLDATFTDNEALAFPGGALYVSENLFLSDAQVISNKASSGGGIAAFGPTTVTNSLFQENISTSSGGGLYINSGFDTGTVVNSQFLSNTANMNGGGFYSLGNLFMTNNLFQSNQATTGSGGGLYTPSSVVVTNTVFTKNMADVDGGGAYINSNSTIISGTFSNNQSINGRGGGMYGNSDVTIDDSQFINNEAGLDGGGLHSNFRTTLAHTTVQNNSAQRSGGGVSIGRLATLSSTMILSNTANLGGGVAISGTSSGSSQNYFINMLLARNQANNSGDAIYHNLNRTLNILHTTIASPTQAANQAVFVISGTVNITNSIVASHTTGIEVIGRGEATVNFINYFGDKTNEIGVNGTNMVTGNPLFVNPGLDDYRLLVGSVSLDNATDAGIIVDILGIPRPTGSGFDRGAYEGAYTPTAVSFFTFLPFITQ